MTRREPWADMQSAAELLLGDPLPSNYIAFAWEFSEEGTAVCVLQHYPEERGGNAHPDMLEHVVLRWCFVGEDNIAPFLSKYYRERIEGLCLRELQSERRKRECEEFDEEAAV